jgi:hypothetical protein
MATVAADITERCGLENFSLASLHRVSTIDQAAAGGHGGSNPGHSAGSTQHGPIGINYPSVLMF